MTRGLMCISSKMPGWMKKFTYSGSRAHLFQFGMTKKKNFLFSDNVGFHQSQQFYETYRNQINTTVYMLPENHTDKIQPIDAGCGRIMKGKIGTAMETWLEEENNLDKWQDRLSDINITIFMDLPSNPDVSLDDDLTASKVCKITLL